ncbi:MAG: flagellar hook-basal body protein [Candidatus Latescibacterota bacterium]|nr:flagellar hook-basal body protein [Candidatus Latescibacterota bacterium]
MIEGLFISASGMLPKSVRQEAIANNLANVEVPGFKKDNMFLREMREQMKTQSGDYPDWRLNRFEGSWTDHEQGKLRQTGDVFDLAISGKGFFALQTPNGTQYTRNGNFSKNELGQLVNPLGFQVLDQAGAPITIPDDYKSPIIDGSGTVRVRDELQGEDTVIAEIQIVDFPELYDRNAMAQTPYQPPLRKGGDGLFIPHSATAQVPAEGTELVQGFVEESNVEPVVEMVKMIDLYRSYEAEQRAIQVQDATLDRAVNDIGRVG